MPSDIAVGSANLQVVAIGSGGRWGEYSISVCFVVVHRLVLYNH